MDVSSEPVKETLDATGGQVVSLLGKCVATIFYINSVTQVQFADDGVCTCLQK